MIASETIKIFLFPSSTKSFSASGVHPSLKYVLGAFNHNVFSLLMATLFTFNSCNGPTCPINPFPPHEPHPSVIDGNNAKLYRSPTPPSDEGVLISNLPAFILVDHSAILSFSLSSICRAAVCPAPIDNRSSALFKASAKSEALYRVTYVDSFSCAKASSYLVP